VELKTLPATDWSKTWECRGDAERPTDAEGREGGRRGHRGDTEGTARDLPTPRGHRGDAERPTDAEGREGGRRTQRKKTLQERAVQMKQNSKLN